jgi:hypothetical protein
MFWLIDSNKLTPKPTKANPRPKPVPDTDVIWAERIASVQAHRENVNEPRTSGRCAHLLGPNPISTAPVTRHAWLASSCADPVLFDGTGNRRLTLHLLLL